MSLTNRGCCFPFLLSCPVIQRLKAFKKGSSFDSCLVLKKPRCFQRSQKRTERTHHRKRKKNTSGRAGNQKEKQEDLRPAGRRPLLRLGRQKGPLNHMVPKYDPYHLSFLTAGTSSRNRSNTGQYVLTLSIPGITFCFPA